MFLPSFFGVFLPKCLCVFLPIFLCFSRVFCFSPEFFFFSPEFVCFSAEFILKKVHVVEESTTASQVGSQDTIMDGSVGSYFDVGSVSEVTPEPRSADEKVCSMDTPNVREGESVDIEIDSGADVSCLPVNIGADTYPLRETRLSMCGGHHVTAEYEAML